MRINTNVSALGAYKNLSDTQKTASESMAKLSSGFRINKAADDAAGLGIANKLRAETKAVTQASRNAEQANAMLQIAEGSTGTIGKMLERMKELATQAGSDNVDDAGRGRIKQEWDALVTEIGQVASTTKFQGKTLIDGGFGNAVDTDDTVSTALAAGTGLFEAKISGAAAGTYTFTQGADGELTIDDGNGNTQTVTGLAAGKQSVTFDKFGISLELDANFDETTAAGTLDGTTVDVTAGSSGGSFLVRSSGSYTSNDLVSVGNLDLRSTTLGVDAGSITLTGNGSATEWQNAITAVDTAIDSVNNTLGDIGASQNRINYALDNAKTTIQNYSAAESVIRDVDMAEEMTKFSKANILAQAGTAMLAQANQAGQGVLQLLRG